MDEAVEAELQAESSEEKYPAAARVWRYCKYIWTALKHFIVLWLLYLAFGKMNTVFEKLVLALLVLILQSVGNSLTSILRSMIDEFYLHRELFLGLYKKFDHPGVEENEENLRKLVKDYKKGNTFYFINLIGNAVVYLYVLWKVFDTLVFS
jgi:hypothetical protein